MYSRKKTSDAELGSEPKSSAFARTDIGNAELLAYLNNGQLLHDHARKKWFRWGEHSWVPDDDGEVHRLAIEVPRVRSRCSRTLAHQFERTEEAFLAKQSESVARLGAMLKIARCLPQIADKGLTWDKEPYLLGVPNGVVDLRTGLLRPGRPEDRITRQARVPFDA